MDLLPDAVFGNEVSYDIARLFLETTYDKLTKAGLELQPLNEFTEDKPQDNWFFVSTGPKHDDQSTHNVGLFINRSPENEIYNMKVEVLIVMHNTKKHGKAGWQATSNLMQLLKVDQNTLYGSLRRKVEKELTTELGEKGLVNGRWNISVRSVKMEPYEGFEWDDPATEKTYWGAAIIFTYDIDVLDEEEFDPYAKEKSDLLKRVGKKFGGKR